MTIRVFCAPGRHSILVTPPTYGMYKVSAAINDVAVQRVNLTPEFQLNVDEVASDMSPVSYLNMVCCAKKGRRKKTIQLPYFLFPFFCFDYALVKCTRV